MSKSPSKKFTSKKPIVVVKKAARKTNALHDKLIQASDATERRDAH